MERRINGIMLENNNDNIKNTSKKSSILIELQYFPPISYFKQIIEADAVILEYHENFQKQTFRNRCEILTSNGIESLIIPIEHHKNNQTIKDIRIDYKQRWDKIHERTIRSAYGKSPFFDFFIEDFCSVWNKKHVFLWDLNIEILTLCLDKLRVRKEIILSKAYFSPENNDTKDLLDLRDKISPNEYSIYRQNSITPYQQIFGNDFVRDLSIIDLLFCAVLDSSELLAKIKIYKTCFFCLYHFFRSI